MTEVRTEDLSTPRVSINLAVTDDGTGNHEAKNDASPNDSKKPTDAKPTDAAKPKEAAAATGASDKQLHDKDSKSKEPSPRKLLMRKHLPAVVDDADVGVEKEHIVTRDDKADLRFMGVLLAYAAPGSAPKGSWEEYRIYRTNGDKHVFARVNRTLEEEGDTYEAEVFDPTPSSVPSQLMKGAREIAKGRSLTWMDAAVAFFGYDPLAKALYRKLDVRFEEQIT